MGGFGIEPSINSKNTLVWGFNNHSARDAILELERRGSIATVAWFGSAPECSHDMIDLFTGNYRHEKYLGYGEREYQEVFDTTIHQFMDLMSRHVFYAEKQFYDLLNIYNELYDIFCYIIVEQKADLLLFSNLPHEGPDLLLYRLAKSMQIPTVMFYQSIFPGKFFYIFDLDDFGTFAQISRERPCEHYTLERNHKKELFYMNTRQISQIPFSLQSGSMTSMLHNIARPGLVKKAWQFRKQKETGAQKNGKEFAGKSGISSRGFSYLERQLSRYKRHYSAKKLYESIVCDNVDLGCNFVYFPLHLQPELTTATLGGIYVDQILAIERLSKKLPEDWFIYVKENPKQTERMRGPWFFSRLAALENVRLLDPTVDTYLLMEQSRFVATITGTAGWEAISGGKNALVFGHPWYMMLPGIFSFDGAFRVEDILTYEIDHDELEKAINDLLQKTGDGIIDEYYTTLVKEFDTEQNSMSIADFIEDLIRRDIP